MSSSSAAFIYLRRPLVTRCLLILSLLLLLLVMFRENLLLIYLFLSPTISHIAAATAITDQEWPLPNTQPLRFTPNGTFQISVFEDLHYGEG